MNARDIRAVVGGDLSDLVAARGLAVVSIERVSSLTSASWDRAAYRLILPDGSSLKGRRVESSEAARRTVELGRYLPGGPFPRPIAHHNAALLFPWIEGTVLSERPITASSLRELGAIQRSVHEVAVPVDLPDADDEYPGRRWREELTARVARLVSAGELESGQGERIVHLAETHAPAVRRVRFVHGDICPENVVVDPQGRLHVIDNDGIDFHAAEFDLARTWYRWPMTASERAIFDDGYGEESVLASFREHFRHWALIVLVGAIEFRVRLQLGGSSSPAARLRELLASDAGIPSRG